jgi:hypothetical protein
MSDMREDMLQSLAKQRATKQERSQALWKMSADERVAAMRRGELTWGQLCEWAIKARHETAAGKRSRCLECDKPPKRKSPIPKGPAAEPV